MVVLIFISVFVMAFAAMVMVFRSLLVRIGSWSKAYQLLGKRYGAKVSYSRNKPRLVFKYGDAQCVLNSVGGRSHNRRTQLKIAWPNRKLKLFISSLGEPVGIMKAWGLKKVDFDSDPKSPFHVYSNAPEKALELVNSTTAWQIQQLIKHAGDTGVEIFLSSGQLKIIKPNYIKQELLLDDFVRFGLGLFDQFKLAISKDLEFVKQSNVVVVSDIICPVCSVQVQENIVTCVRCKTPHCADCWEYNGQCATFACNEKRHIRIDAGHVNSGNTNHAAPEYKS